MLDERTHVFQRLRTSGSFCSRAQDEPPGHFVSFKRHAQEKLPGYIYIYIYVNSNRQPQCADSGEIFTTHLPPLRMTPAWGDRGMWRANPQPEPRNWIRGYVPAHAQKISALLQFLDFQFFGIENNFSGKQKLFFLVISLNCPGQSTQEVSKLLESGVPRFDSVHL